MRTLLLIIFSIALVNVSKAQDPNFSQFFVSPLTLNPALTGKFNGDFRVAGNYRDQWPAISKAFITSTLSFDMPILRNRLSELDTWGVGVLAITDKTANGVYSSNFISVTTAYHKGLDQDGLHQIGIGFQGTYSSKLLDGTKLNFEDELDQLGGFSIPSRETIDNLRLTANHFDLSVGALYNGSTDGFNNFYLGVSAYHLNKPKETYNNDVFYALQPRITLNGGAALPLADDSKTVYISTLYSTQYGAKNIMVGGAVGFLLNNDEESPTNFYAGAWTRFNNVSDAIIPYVGLEFGSFRLGASYDVNISSLKPGSQSRGGLEISLIFIKRPPGYKAMPCPRF